MENNFSNIKFLIVEDDDSQLFVIEETLKRLGFATHGVQLGSEAIDYYREHHDSIILLDYNLPDLNGIDIIDTLRQEGYNVDFITMTAYGNEHVAVTMMKLGARDYIVKDTNFVSFLPSVVKNTVNRILTEKRLIASEEALRQVKQRYYELFEHSKDAVYVSDIEGNILTCNQSMLDLFSYSREEIASKNARELYSSPVDREYFTDEINRVGFLKNFEVKLKTQTGVVLDCIIAASVQKDVSGRVIGYSGIIHDITTRKQAEIKVIESEERYRNLFERIPLGVYRTSIDGIFLDANPGLIQMLGLDNLEEIRRFNTKDFYMDENERLEWQREMDSKGVVVDYPIHLRRKDGNTIWALDSSRAIRKSDGSIEMYEGVVIDTTEKRKADEEKENLIKALTYSKEQIEKLMNEVMELNQELLNNEDTLKDINASKDRLFSIIAHDLKSPFTGFIGLTEVLDNNFASMNEEEVKSITSALHSSAKHTFNLLSNLLEWSKVQGGAVNIQKYLFNLNDQFYSQLSLLQESANQKNIALKNKIDDDVQVFADPYVITTVLRNLISNAIKFTPNGGKISVTTEKDENNILVKVKDSGVGIPKDNLDKLFKIDHQITTLGTSNEKGTGLGLILCKELLDKSNQGISVSSEVGHGTEFTVTLPIPLDL